MFLVKCIFFPNNIEIVEWPQLHKGLYMFKGDQICFLSVKIHSRLSSYLGFLIQFV